ncbi:cytochrome P450 1A1-like [Gigantopelta aegis]|uniref:cytochrome P450 1A1-like n=1 Tax=Gigantopelta aegis TaxID=1735272 RepID=UPI001B88CB66|nr:cytochrome P450 1A1-like [Gigantopelta aegis]XP_041349710.1 cytochrome P450 1A1-like [Gigantopelta aegis]
MIVFLFKYLQGVLPLEISQYLKLDFCYGWIAILVLTLIGIAFLKRSTNSPPGPWAWPIIGHLTYFQQKSYIFLSNMRECYGDVYQLKIGSNTIVVACSLEAIKEGLVEKGDAYSGRAGLESCHSLYGGDKERGVCLAAMDEKNEMKKNFLNWSLDAYCCDSESIEDILALDIVDVVNKFIQADHPFDPFYSLEAACLNMMMKLIFGQRFDPAGMAMREMLSTFHTRNKVRYFNPLDYVPLLKIFRTRDDLDAISKMTENQLEYQRKAINYHKDSYDPENIRDMVDHLLLYIETGEDHALLEKEDIDYLLLDVSNSGYEAIAVTLTWLLRYMAAFPDVQHEIQQELDSVVGRDRLPSLLDQAYLPYTTAVIFETERIASVYPFLQPHIVVENSTLQGYRLSKGTCILFNVWSIHHDSRYWKNPMKFDPHRFINEDKTLEIPDHFMPYGAGTRSCSGESLAEIQLFLFFATIMHQMSVKSEDDKLVPDLEGEHDFLIRPKHFSIAVTER